MPHRIATFCLTERPCSLFKYYSPACSYTPCISCSKTIYATAEESLFCSFSSFSWGLVTVTSGLGGLPASTSAWKKNRPEQRQLALLYEDKKVPINKCPINHYVFNSKTLLWLSCFQSVLSPACYFQPFSWTDTSGDHTPTCALTGCGSTYL